MAAKPSLYYYDSDTEDSSSDEHEAHVGRARNGALSGTHSQTPMTAPILHLECPEALVGAPPILHLPITRSTEDVHESTSDDNSSTDCEEEFYDAEETMDGMPENITGRVIRPGAFPSLPPLPPIPTPNSASIEEHLATLDSIKPRTHPSVSALRLGDTAVGHERSKSHDADLQRRIHCTPKITAPSTPTPKPSNNRNIFSTSLSAVPSHGDSIANETSTGEPSPNGDGESSTPQAHRRFISEPSFSSRSPSNSATTELLALTAAVISNPTPKEPSHSGSLISPVVSVTPPSPASSPTRRHTTAGLPSSLSAGNVKPKSSGNSPTSSNAESALLSAQLRDECFLIKDLDTGRYLSWEECFQMLCDPVSADITKRRTELGEPNSDETEDTSTDDSTGGLPPPTNAIEPTESPANHSPLSTTVTAATALSSASVPKEHKQHKADKKGRQKEEQKQAKKAKKEPKQAKAAVEGEGAAPKRKSWLASKLSSLKKRKPAAESEAAPKTTERPPSPETVPSMPGVDGITPTKKHKSRNEFPYLAMTQRLVDHIGAVWVMKFSPDGRFLATGGHDKTIRVWAVNTKSRSSSDFFSASKGPVRRWVGHQADILDLSWSRNGFLVSSSMDKSVRLWHISRDECLSVFRHVDFVTAVCFHPKNDSLFLSGSLDKKLRIWSISERKVLFWTAVSGFITAVAFADDGRLVLAGAHDGRLTVLETEGLRYVHEIRVRSSRGKNRRGKKITGISVIPAATLGDSTGAAIGSRVLVTSNDSRVRMYRLSPGDYRLLTKYKGMTNTSFQIRASFSERGRYIIAGSENNSVYIWNTRGLLSTRLSRATGRAERSSSYESFKAHQRTVTAAQFAPLAALRVYHGYGADCSGSSGKANAPAASGNAEPCGLGDDFDDSPEKQVIISADLSGEIKVFEVRTSQYAGEATTTI